MFFKWHIWLDEVGRVCENPPVHVDWRSIAASRVICAPKDYR